MKKQMIATILTGILAITALSGCGAGQKKTNDSKTNSSKTNEYKETIIDSLVWDGNGAFSDSVMEYFEKKNLSFFYEDGDEQGDAFTKEPDDFLGHKAYYCKDASTEMFIIVTCDSEEEVKETRADIKEYLSGLEPKDWEKSSVKTYLEDKEDFYEGKPELFYNEKALTWSTDYTDYYVIGCELKKTGNYLVKVVGVTEYNDLSKVREDGMTFLEGNSETYFIIDIGFDRLNGSEVNHENEVDDPFLQNDEEENVDDDILSEVINAYQDYVADMCNGSEVYNLIYVDDDEIPEMLFDHSADGRSTILLSYRNGEVKESDISCRVYDFNYVAGKNRICYGSHFGEDGFDSLGHLEHGVYVEDCNWKSTVDMERNGELSFFFNGIECTEKEYEAKKQEILSDDFVYGWDTYNSLSEAYSHLNKPMDSSENVTDCYGLVEEGDIIRVKVEEKRSGAAETDGWKKNGEEEFEVSVDTFQFDQTDFGLTDEKKRENVNRAIGKGVGDSFELSFSFGDGGVTYRYTILEIK